MSIGVMSVLDLLICFSLLCTCTLFVARERNLALVDYITNLVLMYMSMY